MDFNRTIDGSLVRANTRRAKAGVACVPSSIIVLGDDDWAVARAEVVEHEAATSSTILRLLGDLIDQRPDGAAAVLGDVQTSAR